MPELPEAETIVRGLRPFVEGRRIVKARFLSRRVSAGSPRRLEGRRITAVQRCGKQVHFHLDRGILAVKLGMTGSLRMNHPEGPYTRAVLSLDRGTLVFDDIRQFGSMQWIARLPETLGPDPLEIQATEFAARLRARDTDVKRVLLDQSLVRGVGNIYADEALHRAAIHPKARTRRLSVERAASLHAAIAAVLEEAIAARGSSISDYVDADGAKGGFQFRHRVYQKQGHPCARCGRTIRRIVVGQRGTHFCPGCQKR